MSALSTAGSRINRRGRRERASPEEYLRTTERMSKVIAYQNTDRVCFCQIKFESRERILVSVANVPHPGIKVIKLLFGIIPYKTIWEFSAGGEKKAQKQMIDMFSDPNSPRAKHPLDAIIIKLLPCRSCGAAVMLLRQAEEKFRGA
jgi:hypothetical protein